MYLRLLFAQTPTLLAIVRGPDHVLERANPAMCRVTGLSEPEIVNRPIFEMLPVSLGQRYRPVLDDAYRSGQEWAAQDVEIGPLVVDVVCSPFRHQDGSVEGLFVIAHDVTGRVHARHAAHELRNPLSAILTAAQVMKMRDDTHVSRERAIIERQVSHLAGLVDQLFGAAAPADPSRGPGGLTAPARRGQASASGVRVLVVDDDRDAGEMLALALRTRGHHAEIAKDGHEALRICDGFTPHVALLDLGLPGMDGYELAARLRERPGLEHTRLVAVTGSGQTADRQRTRAAGFDVHLVKPIDLNEVEASLAAGS